MVQVGSTGLPINIIPRIDGKVVTQTQIKNDFSNAFISDGATPLSFTLEYKTVTGTKQTQAWNASKSTASFLVFEVPDSFWATVLKWSINVFWTIGAEINYTMRSYQISVEETLNQ